jgi:SSS family solute:Na+ symporter
VSALDWSVLVGSLLFIVAFGVWRGRGAKDLDGYLLAGRRMQWYTIAISIMATQASAITFLSAPGLGYADGVRFVQFYLGLPIAMVVLCATAVPIYHRLKVYTAYEYLENRFDLKTRSIAAFLFLIQRGLAAGLTIYAPSIILSVLLGWNIYWTNLIIGVLVIIYTTSGGAKAVSYTQFLQMLIIFSGMGIAFVLILKALPGDLGFLDAAYLAGKMGRLTAIDFSFDPNNRYTFWTGIIGGFFLQLSYFGTDQSQVGRYLTGRSVTQSRLGLLFNGLIKIPMQFSILFLGVLIFVFYQFVAPPLFFNPVEEQKLKDSAYAGEFAGLEQQNQEVFELKQREIRTLLAARETGDPGAMVAAEAGLEEASLEAEMIRSRTIDLIKTNDPDANASDTNYIFLNFVINFLPIGVVGLVLAAIFAASMSSTAAELNALASTSFVDVYKRIFGRGGSGEVRASKIMTVFWGIFAIAFAEYASRLGSLIEAVNILGSLVYGTILGIFMVAFLLRRVGGNAVFTAAILAEIAVISCFLFTGISFLWYNVIGCVLVVAFSLLLQPVLPRPQREITGTS